jgi:hypothetical protein
MHAASPASNLAGAWAQLLPRRYTPLKPVSNSTQAIVDVVHDHDALRHMLHDLRDDKIAHDG